MESVDSSRSESAGLSPLLEQPDPEFLRAIGVDPGIVTDSLVLGVSRRTTGLSKRLDHVPGVVGRHHLVGITMEDPHGDLVNGGRILQFPSATDRYRRREEIRTRRYGCECPKPPHGLTGDVDSIGIDCLLIDESVKKFEDVWHPITAYWSPGKLVWRNLRCKDETRWDISSPQNHSRGVRGSSFAMQTKHQRISTGTVVIHRPPQFVLKLISVQAAILRIDLGSCGRNGRWIRIRLSDQLF